MAKSYLLLGSNIGEKAYYLQEARNYIKLEIGEILISSSIYETAPWGFSHENNFINQAIIVETQLLPGALLGKIHDIEHKLGRVRISGQYIGRTIDIDILFYSDRVINEEKLTIPHPHICDRMFALAPLEEISPDLMHPVINKSIREIKMECKDKLPVVRIGRI